MYIVLIQFYSSNMSKEPFGIEFYSSNMSKEQFGIESYSFIKSNSGDIT
jgi:hypothetical protein